ncbi:MAG: short-chain dehydrogenase, partial [Gemmatimonadales bacterium]
TDFGLNALGGGPDSRSFPNSQTAEQVADVIAGAIESRLPDVYTRTGGQAAVASYYATVGVDP